ncbi:transglutaminase family protein [Pedobacter sp. SD-b]|uniref:Transglutaminase family protein n=1 Tax=Pedobacter segetis TaxID=2793069 RepID=A0ABS1BG44_9SPHI|nr:transglutaminase family protein [Pedobacter segetis]MBK0381839.1 transglutaminase family protein [Pedobacter segetis]
MEFEVKAKLKYKVKSDSSIILSIHASDKYQKIVDETLIISPKIVATEMESAWEGNRLISLAVKPAENLSITYKAIVNNSFKIKEIRNVREADIAKLPSDVLPYLYPSRYCQSDKLYRLANNMFGYKKNDFEKVQALTYWIYLNVEYLSGSTDSETSAYDTVTEQAGVCRDFAHLGIALCRALTIPARYFTGYAYLLQPQDFHACFEAYINGQWLLFDATKLVPLNGMIKIATGRDAADAAVANIFGDVDFVSSAVSCDLVDQSLEPFYADHEQNFAISYT